MSERSATRRTERITRRAQAEHRRALLLETALRLFSERGYRATSVRDLTRAAGVTEAVLYHYFTSKADILTAVLVEYAPFTRVSQIIAAAKDAPAPEVLRTLGQGLLRLLWERRELVVTLLGEAPADPDLGMVLGRFLDGVADEIAGCMVTRQERGEVNAGIEPRAVARAFQGAVLARFLLTVIGRTEPDQAADARFIDHLVTALAHGFLPAARPTTASDT